MRVILIGFFFILIGIYEGHYNCFFLLHSWGSFQLFFLFSLLLMRVILIVFFSFSLLFMRVILIVFFSLYLWGSFQLFFLFNKGYFHKGYFNCFFFSIHTGILEGHHDWGFFSLVFMRVMRVMNGQTFICFDFSHTSVCLSVDNWHGSKDLQNLHDGWNTMHISHYLVRTQISHAWTQMRMRAALIANEASRAREWAVRVNWGWEETNERFQRTGKQTS